MYRRTFAIFISVLAVAAIAAGCGSSDDSSTSSLTKAEFIKQASDVCKEINKESQDKLQAAIKTQENVPPAKNVDQVGIEERLISTIVVPALTKQNEELTKLGAPEGDEGEVDAILEALEKVTKEAEENPIGVTSKADPFLEVDQLSKGYGLDACRH
jgi:hypothetical protein